MINHCPLYKRIQKGKIFGAVKNPFNEFIELSRDGDDLGRFRRIKTHHIIFNKNCASLTFPYIRHNFLKKLLLKSMIKELNFSFIENDIKYILLINPYVPFQKILDNELVPDKQLCDNHSEDSVSKFENMQPSQQKSQVPCPYGINKNNNLIEFNAFEGELITINGTIFGLFWINSICVSFKSSERKKGEEYIWGSTEYCQICKTIDQKWKLESIREIVLRRYNLIRQGMEIYFRNNKSIFLSFFSEKCLKEVINKFKKYRTKLNQSYEIIDNPEKYFEEKRFKEKWQQGEISNFEYLMLLNKYGGRSFNDLSQYPVFPWIIGDYDSLKIDLQNEDTYRKLDFTIAGISTKKREIADNKYNFLLNEGEKEDLYQFGTHYLSRRMVLGYMQRIEPYASLLIDFDKGYDHPNRMFHVLKSQWNNAYTDSNDNRELIPEFFYCPEIFGNYNLNSYGEKENVEGLDFLSGNNRVRIDQVILPIWARNNHHFVQINALALESKYVSENLNSWIDLIFGYKQQSKESYNRFKNLCDEEEVSKIRNTILTNQIDAIQEFGVNPIKLFKEKHPVKDKLAIRRAICYSICPAYEINEKKNYSIRLIDTFHSPINNILLSDSKIAVRLKDQSIFHSIEDYNKEPLIVFDKHPYLFYSSQRINELLPRGDVVVLNYFYFATCGFPDNSFKIINIDTGSIQQHLYFHKEIVEKMCATKDQRFLFTGSKDGQIVKWNVNFKNYPPVKLGWYTWDFSEKIISIDACQELDLVASTSLENKIILRAISTGKFIRFIKPNINFNFIEYAIHQIKLSYRGYIIILVKQKSRCATNDFLIVYSINGELINIRNTEDCISSLVIDESGYKFIIGGKRERLLCYDLITLEYNDLALNLHENKKVFEQLFSNNAEISDMALIKKGQELLIGSSNGNICSVNVNKDALTD